MRAARIIMIASLLSAMPFAARVHAQQTDSASERYLFDAANRERASRGLQQFQWNDQLASAARQHAILMAQRNAISHQFPGEADFSARAFRAGAHFSALAENVAEAPSASEIHTEWMNSPPHRQNLLDPQLDSIGISVAVRGGELFASEDFSRAVENLSIEEQEVKLDSLLRAQGLHLLPRTGDARRICEGGRLPSGSAQPLLYFQFDAANLDSLPEQLRSKIESGRYGAAAAGACARSSVTGEGSGGFTAYHLAVLLCLELSPFESPPRAARDPHHCGFFFFFPNSPPIAFVAFDGAEIALPTTPLTIPPTSGINFGSEVVPVILKGTPCFPTPSALRPADILKSSALSDAIVPPPVISPIPETTMSRAESCVPSGAT